MVLSGVTSWIRSFDRSVDDAMIPLRENKVANRAFYAASEAANHSLLWHGLTWIPVVVGKRSWRSAARISLILGAESAIVNGPVKVLFRRARPEEPADRPHALRTPKTSSFPSGHATSAMCAASLLREEGYPAGVIYPLAAVVAISRVHVRIHHASDVVAGACFGGAFGAVAKRILLRGSTVS